jgi:hypothetical protein
MSVGLSPPEPIFLFASHTNPADQSSKGGRYNLMYSIITKDGREDEVRQFVGSLFASVEQIRVFSIYQYKDNPRKFIIQCSFINQAAHSAWKHANIPNFTKLRTMLIEPPTEIVLDKV